MRWPTTKISFLYTCFYFVMNAWAIFRRARTTLLCGCLLLGHSYLIEPFSHSLSGFNLSHMDNYLTVRGRNCGRRVAVALWFHYDLLVFDVRCLNPCEGYLV